MEWIHSAFQWGRDRDFFIIRLHSSILIAAAVGQLCKMKDNGGTRPRLAALIRFMGLMGINSMFDLKKFKLLETIKSGIPTECMTVTVVKNLLFRYLR